MLVVAACAIACVACCCSCCSSAVDSAVLTNRAVCWLFCFMAHARSRARARPSYFFPPIKLSGSSFGGLDFDCSEVPASSTTPNYNLVFFDTRGLHLFKTMFYLLRSIQHLNHLKRLTCFSPHGHGPNLFEHLVTPFVKRISNAVLH